MREELAAMDATAQAELVRRREATPLELVEAAIGAVERLDPGLNSVVTRDFERAARAARSATPEGPFAGVPYLVKDLNTHVAGVRLSEGSRLVGDFMSPIDQEIILRHRRAGLIPLGKSNTPEFGILPTTESAFLGPARNPWNPGHSTGGSSGGSAAAVAAGLVPLAHASDGGGSIRIPASCCGLFGLKPTRMRTPTGPLAGDGLAGFSVQHAVTRSVRDSAILLDATAGPDAGAPYFAAPPARPFAQEVGADPGRLRIGFSTVALTGPPVDPECVRAVEVAARLCEELGHHVFEHTPSGLDADQISAAFLLLYNAGVAATVAFWAQTLKRRPKPELVEPLTWAMYEAGTTHSAAEYLIALGTLQVVARQIAAEYERMDLWLTPVLTEPPPELGSFDAPEDNPLLPLLRASLYAPFTPVANFTGQPAMSVPLHWTPDHLPVGSHFTARYGDEATLIRLASQLEQARPWATRRPPVWAGAVTAAPEG